MEVYEDSSTVYFVENNRWIKEATVITKRGNLYTLRFDGHRGTCLRAGRLFPTYELAEQSIYGRTKTTKYHAPLLH